MKDTHLVQRAKFRSGAGPGVSIDQLLDYDYMGSAEFEFGALGNSYKRILADLPSFNLFYTGLSAKDGRKLWFVCCQQENGEVYETVRAIALNQFKARLKERAKMFETLAGERFADNDVWWDIENDWIAFLASKGDKNLVLQALRSGAQKKASK